MKILLVGTCLGFGGAERVMVDLADALSLAGNEVALVALKGEALLRPKDPGVSIHCLGARGMGNALAVALRLRAVIRSFRPDVVHAHLFHAIVFTRILRLFVPIPFLVTTAHNTKVGGWIRMLAYRITEPFCDVSTNVSQEAVHAFVRKWAANARKMQVVHNGISLELYCRQPGARERIGTELGLPESVHVFAAVGRLAEQKDYRTMLEALAVLKQSSTDFVVLIAGAGEMRGELEELSRSLGTTEHVRFLGLRRDVPTLLSAADVFVLSSAWEGFPMVVGEAMACECSVVATDCGGVREFLGDAGFIVPRRNPEALAGALLQVMRLGPAGRSVLGKRARERVRRHFSLDASVEQWLRIYGAARAR